MRSVCVVASLATIAISFPSLVHGDIDVEGENQLREVDSELYDRPLIHHWRRHPFLRHRHRRNQPLLKHHRTAFLVEEPTDNKDAVRLHIEEPTDNKDAVHPTIARKLENMPEAIHELSGRHQVAAEARNALESDVKKVLIHMNQAVSIRHMMARTRIQLRSEEQKLRRLEEDLLRIDRNHVALSSNLHHIMGPKINSAETRFVERQRQAKKLDEEAQRWKEKRHKFHSAALAVIEERRAAKDRLEVANEAMQKAHHEQRLARKAMSSVKRNVGFDVQGFQYARAKARAARSQAETSKEARRKAQMAVTRLRRILALEQKHVDASLAHGTDKVQHKIHELAGREKRSVSRLKTLQAEYREWQQREAAWVHRVSASKLMTDAAADAFAKKRQAVFDAAQAKVAYDAEAGADWAWDDWPGLAGRGDPEELTMDSN